jgi:hypothetical protein
MDFDTKMREVLQKEARIKHNHDGEVAETILFPSSRQVDEWVAAIKQLIRECKPKKLTLGTDSAVTARSTGFGRGYNNGIEAYAKNLGVGDE